MQSGKIMQPVWSDGVGGLMVIFKSNGTGLSHTNALHDFFPM